MNALIAIRITKSMVGKFIPKLIFMATRVVRIAENFGKFIRSLIWLKTLFAHYFHTLTIIGGHTNSLHLFKCICIVWHGKIVYITICIYENKNHIINCCWDHCMLRIARNPFYYTLPEAIKTIVYVFICPYYYL